MSHDDAGLDLPDDLRAVEALLLAVRDVPLPADLAARARAAAEAEAIGTPVEGAAPIGTPVDASKASPVKALPARPRPGHASARLSARPGEVGRLRSKVALLQLAGGLLGVVLLVGGYQWANFAAAPPPPPPRVTDDGVTLRSAQQLAKDGYRKASEARVAPDRSESGRLFREALADLDAALAIYEELFEKYPGEKYDYLGPEVDRLNQAKMAIRKELASLPASSSESPPSPASLGMVEASLQNLPGKARYEVQGGASGLPDGALLSVSLRVRDVRPVVELAFFRAELRGGSFSGSQEWPVRTLAAMGYQTVVTLHLQSQSPSIRRSLSKELGGDQEVELIRTIATADHDVGTPAEQARYADQSLRERYALVTRGLGLHVLLARRLDPTLAPPDDPERSPASFEAALEDAFDAVRAARGGHVVPADPHGLQVIEDELVALERCARDGAQGRDVMTTLIASGERWKALMAGLSPHPGR